MLKFEEVKAWDNKTIDNKVTALRAELFQLRMQGAVATMEKPHEKKNLKHDIARLLTAKSLLKTRE